MFLPVDLMERRKKTKKTKSEQEDQEEHVFAGFS